MHLLNIILFGMAVLAVPMAGQNFDPHRFLQNRNIDELSNFDLNEHLQKGQFNIKSLIDRRAGRNQFPPPLLRQVEDDSSNDTSDDSEDSSDSSQRSVKFFWSWFRNCRNNPDSRWANRACARSCLRNPGIIGGYCKNRECECVPIPTASEEPPTTGSTTDSSSTDSSTTDSTTDSSTPDSTTDSTKSESTSDSTTTQSTTDSTTTDSTTDSTTSESTSDSTTTQSTTGSGTT